MMKALRFIDHIHILQVAGRYFECSLLFRKDAGKHSKYTKYPDFDNGTVKQ